MKTTIVWAIVMFGLMVFSATVSDAEPMGTVFTYQGRLMDSNDPADGIYEFEFKVYDSAVDGNQLDGTFSLRGVDVIDGYFTVELDFGGGVFVGDARWLGIGVRPSGTADPFTTLSPRQEVTPTPYALYAESAGGDNDWAVTGNDMYSIPSGNVGIGTKFPNKKLTVAYGGFAVYPGPSEPVIITDGYNVKLGDPDGMGNQVFLEVDDSGNKFVFNNGNVGIGTTSPEHKLTVKTSETTGRATYSEATASPGSGVVNYGGYFVSKGGRGKGVYGEASHTGDFQNEGGRFAACGRYGRGVYGNATGESGRGVYGLASSSSGTNYGVYGQTYSSTGYAGYFNGRVSVTGNLSKGGGSFKIDHPLDPENKYLQHSFVESPDMMNVYNGNVVLDKNGEAVVKLPEYFEALNQDFRYQLTCIGGFAPVYVAEEISENGFKIGGGRRGMKVSWQVTGIRHDAYAKANRIAVEEDKAVEARGYYLHPELYGHGGEKSIEAARNAQVSEIRQVARKTD